MRFHSTRARVAVPNSILPAKKETVPVAVPLLVLVTVAFSTVVPLKVRLAGAGG